MVALHSGVSLSLGIIHKLCEGVEIDTIEHPSELCVSQVFPFFRKVGAEVL